MSSAFQRKSGKRDYKADAIARLAELGPTAFISETRIKCNEALAFNSRKANGIFHNAINALLKSKPLASDLYNCISTHVQLWQQWRLDRIQFVSTALTTVYLNSSSQCYDDVANRMIETILSDESDERIGMLIAFGRHIDLISNRSKAERGKNENDRHRMRSLSIQLIRLCRQEIENRAEIGTLNRFDLTELNLLCTALYSQLGIDNSKLTYLNSALIHAKRCEDEIRDISLANLNAIERCQRYILLLRASRSFAEIEFAFGTCGFTGQVDAAQRAVAHLDLVEQEFQNAKSHLVEHNGSHDSELPSEIIHFTLIRLSRLLQAFKRKRAERELLELDKFCMDWPAPKRLSTRIEISRFLLHSHGNLLQAWWLFRSLWLENNGNPGFVWLMAKWSNVFLQLSNILEFKYQYDAMEPSLNAARAKIYPHWTKNRRRIEDHDLEIIEKGFSSEAVDMIAEGTLKLDTKSSATFVNIGGHLAREDISGLIEALIWAQINNGVLESNSVKAIERFRDALAVESESKDYVRFQRIWNEANCVHVNECLLFQIEFALLCFPRLAIGPIELLIKNHSSVGSQLWIDLTELYIDMCLNLEVANIALKKGLHLVELYAGQRRWNDARRLSDALLRRVKVTLASVASIADRDAILNRLHNQYMTLLAMRVQMPNGMSPPRLFAELDSAKDWRLVLEQDRRPLGYHKDVEVRGSDLVQTAQRLTNELGLGPTTFVQISRLDLRRWACSILRVNGHLASVLYSKILQNDLDELSKDMATLWRHVSMDHEREHYSNEGVWPILSKLSSVFLNPIRKHMSGTIIVVLDSFFSELPFHMLPIDGKVLGRICNVSYFPSIQAVANVVSSDSECELERSGLILGMDFGRRAVNEANEIARMFSGCGIRVRAEKREARYAREFLASNQKFGIMYVAGHADEINAVSPLHHRLRVGDGLVITPQSIIESPFSAGYYVLNGCNTGETIVKTGDQLGFVYSVFGRRAMGCLLAKGTISAKAAYEIGVAFARNLVEGGTSFDAYKRLLSDGRLLTKKLPYFQYGLPARFAEFRNL